MIVHHLELITEQATRNEKRKRKGLTKQEAFLRNTTKCSNLDTSSWKPYRRRTNIGISVVGKPKFHCFVARGKAG